MNAKPTTQLDGDVSVGGRVTAGGDAAIRGSATVGHNLKVEGWLDAPNVKYACKGLFPSAESLRQAYPLPQAGWWAVITQERTDTPTCIGRIYRTEQGRWIPVCDPAGEAMFYHGETADVTEALSAIDALKATADDHASRLEALSRDAALHKSQSAAQHEEMARRLSNSEQRTTHLEEQDAARGYELEVLSHTASDLQAKAEECEESVATLRSDLDLAGGCEIFGTVIDDSPELLTASSGSFTPFGVAYCKATGKFVYCSAPTFIPGMGTRIVGGEEPTQWYSNWSGAERYGTHTFQGRTPLERKIYVCAATMQAYTMIAGNLTLIDPDTCREQIQPLIDALTQRMQNAEQQADLQQTQIAGLSSSIDTLRTSGAQTAADVNSRLGNIEALGLEFFTAESRRKDEALEAKIDEVKGCATRDVMEVDAKLEEFKQEAGHTHVGLWDELDKVKQLISASATGEVQRLLRMLGYTDADIEEYIAANMNYDLGLTMEDLYISAYRWHNSEQLEKPFECPVMPKWTEACEQVWESPYAMQEELFIMKSNKYFPAITTDKKLWVMKEATYVARSEGEIDFEQMPYSPLVISNPVWDISGATEMSNGREMFFGKNNVTKPEIKGIKNGYATFFNTNRNMWIPRHKNPLIDASGTDISQIADFSYMFGCTFEGYGGIKVGEWDLAQKEGVTLCATFGRREVKDSEFVFPVMPSWIYGVFEYSTLSNVKIHANISFQAYRLERENGGIVLGTHLFGRNAPLVKARSEVHSTSYITIDSPACPQRDSLAPLIYHVPNALNFHNPNEGRISPVAFFDMGNQRGLSEVNLASPTIMMPYTSEVKGPGKRLIHFDFQLFKESMLSWADRCALGFDKVNVYLPNLSNYNEDMMLVQEHFEDRWGRRLDEVIDNEFIATMNERGYTLIFD